MFQSLLEQIAKTFDAHGIPYMLIGGQAVLLYGEPRLTQDVDITLGIGPDHLDAVLQAVTVLRWRVLVTDVEAFVRKTLVLPCQTRDDGIRVDLIFSFSPYERRAIERARLVPVGGERVRFASPEDLIIHKIVAGRPRDLEDVAGILVRNPDVDIAYIEKYLAQFEEVLARPLLSQFHSLLADNA